MNNITIQVDTRENKNENLIVYFESKGIKTVRSKLYVGDYTLLHKQDVCVDKKKDLMEMASCICGPNHTRFREELIRSKEANIKLYILIEDEYIYSI